MDSEDDSGHRPPFGERFGAFPADLTAVVVTALLSVAVVSTSFGPELLSLAVAVPTLLFAPGYAFVAALFPGASPRLTPETTAGDETNTENRSPTTTSTGISVLARFVLSFGSSISFVALLSLILTISPLGAGLLLLLIPVTLFTLVSALVGARRRTEIPPENRLSVPYMTWVSRIGSGLFDPKSRTDLALNVALVAALLLVLGGGGYVVASPQQTGTFTEFYLLAGNETEDPIADEYPTEFVSGEPQSVVVGIENQEYEPVSYTVVTKIQRVRVENNTTTVLEERSLQQFSVRVEHGETWQQRHQVTPTMTGEQLRLTYLLYRGDPPANATTENAYRHLDLWVSVSPETDETG